MHRSKVFAVAVDVETHDWRNSYQGRTDYIGRIVQLGFVVYDVEGNELHSQVNMIKPDGFVIAAKAVWYHGISNERAGAEGGFAG